MFTLALLAVVIAALAIFTNVLNTQLLWAIFAAICAYIVINFILLITGSSFDGYFTSLFNERLDSGEVIIIIDVDKKHAKEIEQQLDQHPDAQFLADSSNLASPIPE